LKMKEKLISQGGEVYTNCQIDKIDLENKRIKTVTFRENGKMYCLACDIIVSTITPSDLVRLIRPKLEDRIFELADSLKFRAMLFVYFILDQPFFSDNAWFYFPEPRFIFNRIFEQKNYSPFVCPENKTFLGAEISCDENDELWQLEENELFEKALENICQIGIIRRSDIERCFSARTKYAYPKYDLGYKKRRDELLKRLSAIDNLLINGRQGLFNYNNMDHSVKMGIDAAELISSGSFTPERWLKITEEYDSYRIID